MADWRLTTGFGPLPGPVLAEVAASTRAAFRAAEPVPQLPAPDGAAETAASVAADLAAGAWLCLARLDGRIVGSVRAFVRPDGDWEVRRLAVVPALHGSGLARALMGRLEEAARAGGAASVHLDAVVERGNPPFYARLGYRTVRHFANPDKPLSEVSMRRELDRPAHRLDRPWRDESAPADYRLVVTWHADERRTVARVHTDVRDAIALVDRIEPGMALLGADGWRDAGDAAAGDIHRLLGGSRADGPDVPVVFRCAPQDIPAYRMPRTVHTRLLALWRLPRRPRRP